ncbi:MAG: imidazoleglycerol-phosphate dehydratase HisB [Candidatus Latescibacterota bacterium]
MTQERRTARVVRRTAETDVEVALCLDGSGAARVETGIGFFDHMLASFARHGLFDLEVRCQGDLHVDAHHTVEDVGIGLGQALAQALGDKAGVERFGHSLVPMDEALARAVVDLSGRSYLVLEASFRGPQVGQLPLSLIREFFRALADHGRLNLHLDLLRAHDDHHAVEALFKACARALGKAVERSARVQGIPSTKGSL